MIHVDATIVHFDPDGSVVFKLTPMTINSITTYHRTVHCAKMVVMSDAYQEMAVLRSEFASAMQSFVYRTDYTVLEGMYEDGSGELLEGRSEQVKQRILDLFKTLPALPTPSPSPSSRLAWPLSSWSHVSQMSSKSTMSSYAVESSSVCSLSPRSDLGSLGSFDCQWPSSPDTSASYTCSPADTTLYEVVYPEIM